MPSGWVHREGVDLHVLDTAGAGPPVVVLHGLAGSAREFWPTARALAPTPEGLAPRFAPDIMEATMVGLQQPRWPEWESLAVPTLAVFAEHGLFTQLQKQELIDRRPTTHRADLQGASHDAHLDPRGQWIPVLKEWLTRPL